MTENKNNSQREFYWSDTKEPHVERRKNILKKYPEVKRLYGNDHKLAFSTIALVVIQLIVAVYIQKLPLIYLIIISYVVGATITHALFLAIHEITHYLAFKKRAYNNWLALIANLPIIFPYAMSFQIYHAMHHWQQGKDKIDTDIPSRVEAEVFRGIPGKVIWALNQILFYAFRPVCVKPIKLTKWQAINFIFQVSAMVIYIYFAGWGPLVYLLLSAFFAGSLHPVAGHFISEHYVFKEGQETYSYYGPLNKLTFNVGYHNEHHDFPAIPGSRLPQLKKIAPEFYDSLYSHKSWVLVLWKFIFNSSVGLYSRIKRA
jgi:sphingolipid delta-4 desaturase